MELKNTICSLPLFLEDIVKKLLVFLLRHLWHRFRRFLSLSALLAQAGVERIENRTYQPPRTVPPVGLVTSCFQEWRTIGISDNPRTTNENDVHFFSVVEPVWQGSKLYIFQPHSWFEITNEHNFLQYGCPFGEDWVPPWLRRVPRKLPGSCSPHCFFPPCSL